MIGAIYSRAKAILILLHPSIHLLLPDAAAADAALQAFLWAFQSRRWQLSLQYQLVLHCKQ